MRLLRMLRPGPIVMLGLRPDLAVTCVELTHPVVVRRLLLSSSHHFSSILSGLTVDPFIRFEPELLQANSNNIPRPQPKTEKKLCSSVVRMLPSP